MLKVKCVVDIDGMYKDIVVTDISQDENGEPYEHIQGYTLKEGDQLINTSKPSKRQHAGSAGFVRPRWDEGAAAWVEGASAEEIAAWEAEHPAPERPGPPEPSGDLEQRVADLETDKADKTEVQAVWDQMAEAYQEGVQSA